jgi:hypothetical protein
MSGTIPDFITEIVGLKVLLLGGNTTGTIPEKFYTLIPLASLGSGQQFNTFWPCCELLPVPDGFPYRV